MTHDELLGMAERFWAKVNRDGPDLGLGPCWVWTGTTDEKGYGRFYLNHRQRILAHRFSFLVSKGVLEEDGSYHGTCVLHRCDNPACVNPEHLRAGTNKENVEDRVVKGRCARGERAGLRKHPERAARGERNGSAKLTLEQVCAIRSRRESGEGVVVLAKEFGVSKQLISAICTNKVWTSRTIRDLRTENTKLRAELRKHQDEIARLRRGGSALRLPNQTVEHKLGPGNYPASAPTSRLFHELPEGLSDARKATWLAINPRVRVCLVGSRSSVGTVDGWIGARMVRVRWDAGHITEVDAECLDVLIAAS